MFQKHDRRCQWWIAQLQFSPFAALTGYDAAKRKLGV